MVVMVLKRVEPVRGHSEGEAAHVICGRGLEVGHGGGAVVRAQGLAEVAGVGRHRVALKEEKILSG